MRHGQLEQYFSWDSPAANTALLQCDIFIYIWKSVILPLHHCVKSEHITIMFTVQELITKWQLSSNGNFKVPDLHLEGG